MKRRVITIALATSVLLSFTACDMLNGLINKQTETTAVPTVSSESSETTTAEETTTVEETTTEETTTEETSTSEETTTVESTEATTKQPTKKPAKMPTKKPVTGKIPKGFSKFIWGKKYKGKKYYIIINDYASRWKYWKNGKWVEIYCDNTNDYGDYQDFIFYTDKAQKNFLCKYRIYDD